MALLLMPAGGRAAPANVTAVCVDKSRGMRFRTGIYLHVPILLGEIHNSGKKQLCWSIYYTHGFAVKGL